MPSKEGITTATQVRREGGGGESFPGPATFGGPCHRSKNTEKGVQDGFFLTWNMHKSIFGHPRHRGRAYDASPDP